MICFFSLSPKWPNIFKVVSSFIVKDTDYNAPWLCMVALYNSRKSLLIGPLELLNVIKSCIVSIRRTLHGRPDRCDGWFSDVDSTLKVKISIRYSWLSFLFHRWSRRQRHLGQTRLRTRASLDWSQWPKLWVWLWKSWFPQGNKREEIQKCS